MPQRTLNYAAWDSAFDMPVGDLLETELGGYGYPRVERYFYIFIACIFCKAGLITMESVFCCKLFNKNYFQNKKETERGKATGMENSNSYDSK